MSRVLIIGCGGVATVAINKCCQNSEVFTEICIASRTKSKCDALKDKLQPDTKTVITTAKVDADNVEELVKLIESYKPEAVLNLALPYQDLWMPALRQRCIILILLTMKQKIPKILSGELYMKKDVRKKVFQLILIILGSGIIRSNLKKLE